MVREALTTTTGVPLRIEIALEDGISPRTQSMGSVYAFARSGQLIDRARMTAHDAVTLSLPDLRVSQEVRVMVGPDVEEDDATIVELTRRGAIEQMVRVSPGIVTPCVRLLVSARVHALWSRASEVRGVLRRYDDDSGCGRPVAGAMVQIWEVEPVELMIERLPEPVIDDFRSLLAGTAGHEPHAIHGSNALRLRAARPLIATELRRVACLAQFDPLRHAADSTNGELRAGLTANARALRLLVCLLYPAWIRRHLLASALTDDDGRFAAIVFPSSHCEALNVCFTASARHYSASLPVYDPRPSACFIHWDFRGGHEVELRATDDPWEMIGASLRRDARWTPREITATGIA